MKTPSKLFHVQWNPDFSNQLEKQIGWNNREVLKNQG